MLFSNIRIFILSIIALISLTILILYRPSVPYNSYAKQELKANSLENTTIDKEGSKNWTKNTRGHRIALAIANALTPSGKVEDLPEPLTKDEEQ